MEKHDLELHITNELQRPNYIPLTTFSKYELCNYMCNTCQNYYFFQVIKMKYYL